MRWKTVIWFTVTLSIARAVHYTIDADLIASSHLNQTRDVDPLTPAPVPEEPSREMNTAESTTNSVTIEILLTSTPLTSTEATTIKTEATTVTTEATTITTEATIISTNADQTTAAPTMSDGNDDDNLSIIPGTPPAGTTVPNVNQPAQVGRSSEIVEESGQPEVLNSGEEEEYVVLTTRGPVQGYPWFTNTEIIAYIDIPYGSFQRFQDPTPPSSWEQIHQVKEHNKRCPQLQENNYVGDLDCLTLSIFTPSVAVNASVLFHIHESNFVRGSGDPLIYGPDYFVSKGVILVLPNYRLGPLGFLCLSNAAAPGNAALKDLTFALRWVRENIRSFGGDPSKVVVSGDGTSGALAGYLALSSDSNGYFMKAITESGSVLSPWALDRNPSATANALLENIREISMSNVTINNSDIRLIVLATRNIIFAPCIEHNDHPFLSDTPWSILHNSVVNITFMIGTASHAGAIQIATINETTIEQMNGKFERFLPNDLCFVDRDSRTAMGNAVRNQYFGNETITLAHVEEMSLCFTDSDYLGPAARTARALMHAGATVFFYEFGFVGELNRVLDSINRPLNGTVSGDIVGYLFSQDGVIASEGTAERKIIDLLMKLWINFIESGNPSTENIAWTAMNTTSVSTEPWLSIGEEVEMRRGLHEDRLQLWTAIYAEHFIEHNSAQQDLPIILSVLFPLITWVELWKPSL